jgi:hypothetical protein
METKETIQSELKNSPLTPRDVCEIIRVCSETGVHRISFAGLRVSFKGGHPEDKEREFTPVKETPEVVAAAEKHDEETRKQDDLRARDLQMAEIAIVDPLQYEELMEQEELVDAKRPNRDEISAN